MLTFQLNKLLLVQFSKIWVGRRKETILDISKIEENRVMAIINGQLCYSFMPSYLIKWSRIFLFIIFLFQITLKTGCIATEKNDFIYIKSFFRAMKILEVIMIKLKQLKSYYYNIRDTKQLSGFNRTTYLLQYFTIIIPG